MDKIRCEWANCHPLAKKYHDDEWGNPVHDDRIHFEYLFLEVMQCGLNWLTILKKREAFRINFDNFDFIKISQYKIDKINTLMQNVDMIRSRKKIDAVIHNANRYIEIRNEYGTFDNYLWSFTDNSVITVYEHSEGHVPSQTALSDIISKDLKKRGFKFLGSITVYAHLQAAGLINDHNKECFKFKELDESKRK